MCVYSIELILIHTSLHHRRLYHSAWITATLSSVVNPTSAGWLSRMLVGRGVDISTVLCSPATACHTSSLTYIKLNVAVAICRGVPQGVRKTASLWRNPILQHNTPCISTQKPFNLWIRQLTSVNALSIGVREAGPRAQLFHISSVCVPSNINLVFMRNLAKPWSASPYIHRRS